MDNAQDATIEQFDFCSKNIAFFLRAFGEQDHLKDDLRTIALWGQDSTIWIEPFSDRIVSVRGDDQPVRIHPWKDTPEQVIAGRCANLCGAWMMGLLWTMVFKENPKFPSRVTAPTFWSEVDLFIAEHFESLEKRVAFVIEKRDYSQWLALSEAMEIERVRLLAKFQVHWSIPRSPSDWLKVFENLNVDCRSLPVFERRRKAGVFRQHPDSKSKSVRLALEDLPPTYNDEMTV